MQLSLDSALTELKSHIDQRSCFFFVGAGISKDPPSCLPLANEVKNYIAEALFERSEVVRGAWGDNLIEFRKWFETLRFESLFSVLPNSAYESFFPLLDVKRPNHFHQLLAHCLASGIPVVTTNFDTLIEECLPPTYANRFIDEYQCLELLEKAHRDPSELNGALLKVHGSRESVESLVASLSAFGEQGHGLQWQRGKRTLLELLIRTSAMVGIGYSLADDFDVSPVLQATTSRAPLFWVAHVSDYSDDSIRAFMADDLDDWRHVAEGRTDLRDYLYARRATIFAGRQLSHITAALQFVSSPYIAGPSDSVHDQDWANKVSSWIDNWHQSDGEIEMFVGRLARLKGDLALTEHMLRASLGLLERPLRASSTERALRLWLQCTERLSQTLVERREFQEPNELLSLANSICSTYARQWAALLMAMGSLHRSQRMLAEAEEDFTRAMNLSLLLNRPHEANTARTDLVSIKIMLGKTAEAEQLQRIVEKIDQAKPDLGGIYSDLNRARILRRDGQYATARQLLEQCRSAAGILPGTEHLLLMINDEIRKTELPEPPVPLEVEAISKLKTEVLSAAVVLRSERGNDAVRKDIEKLLAEPWIQPLPPEPSILEIALNLILSAYSQSWDIPRVEELRSRLKSILALKGDVSFLP